MNAAPAVDVVVVSWNTRDDLLRCLDSVLASRGVDVHAIVVDNASADGSADAVAARHPTVTLVRNTANEGFARGCNRGILAGASPWVMLLNPDTVVPPDALRRLVDALAPLPRHALVAPRLVREDGSVEHSAHPLPSLGVEMLLATGADRLLPRAARSRLLLEGGWRSDQERDVPWVVGAAMLVRRQAIDRCGPLDERFFMYAEDLEWCDRLRRGGWSIRFVPSVEIIHHGNRSGAQRYAERRTAAYLSSTRAFVERRHGALWVRAWRAAALAGTAPRALGWRAIARATGSERAGARAEMWRRHVRAHLGRAGATEPPAG